MALDLEIAGPVRALTVDDAATNAPVTVKRLRASHHAAARLLARGMSVFHVSLQTGYSPDRLASLKRDPTFVELMSHYARTDEAVAQDVEAQFLEIAKDAAQSIQENMLDDPAAIPVSIRLDVFKAFADRAGFAPVQRSINKNVNLNIGERLDAARRRKDEVA